MEDREDRIIEEFACPKCKENRTDHLPWQGEFDAEDEHILCASCGTRYKLIVGEKEVKRTIIT